MGTTIADQELVYDGWYKLYRLRLRLADGREVERHLEDHGSAAGVLPYDPVRRVALVVSMPRAPAIVAGEPTFWEAAAGNLDGSDPESCARSEADEEAGVRLRQLEAVATIWSMPALSTERLHLYLAPYTERDRVGMGGGLHVEGEYITVEEPSLDELRSRLLNGTLVDAKLIILVQALMLRRPELFC